MNESQLRKYARWGAIVLALTFVGWHDSSNAAAWVQAIGSLAAVWAAFEVGFGATRAAESARQEEERHTRKIFESTCTFALNLCDEVTNPYEELKKFRTSANYLADRRRRFREMYEILSAIDVSRLSGAGILDRALHIRATLRTIDAVLEYANINGSENWDESRRQLGIARETIRRFKVEG